jgi:hypothetical protein
MNDQSSNDFSPIEKELLQHETLVARILEIRKSSIPDERKQVWLLILESPVIAALIATLITVVIGGILGQRIINAAQEKAKNDEQSLQKQKQLLDRQEDIIQRAYSLAGNCISDSHRLISLTDQINEVESVSEPFRNAVRERRIAILNRHYALLDEWQIESNKIGLLISHYFNAQGLREWRECQKGIDDLLECSIKVYREYMEDPRKQNSSGVNPCQGRLDLMKTKLDELAATVERARGSNAQTQTK